MCCQRPDVFKHNNLWLSVLFNLIIDNLRYSEKQRAMMTRDYIVPDCLGFYLLSLNPLPEKADTAGLQRRWHMAKIQTVVNQAMGRKIFSNEHIDQLEKYWRKHRGLSTADFLLLDSISLK